MGVNSKNKRRGVKRTILVTGGAGYVGSVLLRRLLAAGYRAVCLDNLSFGGDSLIDIWDHQDFGFENADLCDFTKVKKIISDYHFYAVIHLAAVVGDPACKREPERAVKINKEASEHLLETTMKGKIQRFIFASTCSNYGKMENNENYVNEKSALAPVSLYAELKVNFEDIILNQLKKDKAFCPTSLRFATVYGMSPRMRFDLTVNEFTKELALGRKLVVFGEQFWRPYCHVSDFSRAMLTILSTESQKVAYEVFNVGDTSENYTKKMIVDELMKKIPDAKIKYVKKDEDPRDYRVNFTKINKRIGFKISKTVPQGMADILACLRKKVIVNPDDQKYYNIPIG